MGAFLCLLFFKGEYMEKTLEIRKLIHNLKNQKESLKYELNLGIIDSNGAENELEMINKKEK